MKYNEVEVLAGTCAGIVGTFLGYPLDVIKTRMQTDGRGSIIFAVKSVRENYGLLGFFRGISSPLLALTLLNTLNFSTYNVMLRELRERLQHPNTTIDFRVSVAGGSVGLLSSLISTPFELVKTQAQLNAQKNVGTFQTAKAIVRKFSFQHLYTGHGVNTLREIIFLSAYFSIYEECKLLTTSSLPLWLAIPIAGGVAGASGWFISYPLDCIKGNLQGRSLDSPKKTALQAATDIIHKRGLAGIYSGVVPSLLRSFIVSSSRFVVYEYVCAAFQGAGVGL